tara:strand:+ start:555 stop:743 length:189 start_codon:yes stop_codon:yes gene_type:complete
MKAFEHLNKGQKLRRLQSLVEGGWNLETADRLELVAILDDRIAAYAARLAKQAKRNKEGGQA